MLPSILLQPILPFLGWGPLTHTYINKKVLDYLKENSGPLDDDARTALSKPGNEKFFILTAGYPDIIKSKGFLMGDMSYDYAHNPLPQRYYGQPQFAIDMYRHFRASGNPELMVLSLSWLAHQIADIFAHHAPLNGFWGYANREIFFGPFWNEVVNHVGENNLGDLPGEFYKADHWISEMVIDMFCYLDMGAEWSSEMLGDTPDEPLSQFPGLSRAYINTYKDTLLADYREITPIETAQLIRGKKFSDALSIATCRYFDSVIRKRSEKTILKMINDHEKLIGLKGMLENVSYITSTALMEPDTGWKPPVLHQEHFIKGISLFEDVFPAELKPEKYDEYFSRDIYEESKKIQPKREGIVKLVLEKIPLDPVKWFVRHSSLITSGSFINRMLLPSGWNSYALSLRYAFNIRECQEKNFIKILRKTLADADIIAPS